jgi:hypothetical protein
VVGNLRGIRGFRYSRPARETSLEVDCFTYCVRKTHWAYRNRRGSFTTVTIVSMSDCGPE